ncbi:MAG: fumD [Caulobacter sp.]|nr:fumD [Caulobacter sp.]
MSAGTPWEVIEIPALGGRVRGLVAHGVRVFRGLRYAQPPAGPLRWAPPQSLASRPATVDATAFGPDAPQDASNAGFAGTRSDGQSEDCLCLNIWSPARAEALPVMVWIHGGGFVGGSGSNITFDGCRLAALGVVVVTINYRCGVFGYLCHPELAAQSDRGVSGNFGLLDQLAALQWVRDHIADFGGDPGNITAFGESAGATSISHLLTSPLARGLIDKAILQSPGPMRGLMPHAEAAERGAALGSLETLRSLSAAELVALNERLVSGFRKVVGPRALGPVLDGWVLPAQDWEAYARNEVLAVPLLLGCNGDEGELFARHRPLRTVERFHAYIEACFGDRTRDALTHYGVDADSGITPAVSRLFGDTQFVYGTRGVARAMSRLQPRTFLYWFDARRAGQSASPTHGDELPYVFGTLDEPLYGQAEPYGQEDRAMSDMVMTAWTSFARTGEPDLPACRWPAVGANDLCVVLSEQIEIRAFPRTAALDFLDQVLGPRAS